MRLIEGARLERDAPAAGGEAPSREATPSRGRALRLGLLWVVATLLWSLLCGYVLNVSTFIGQSESAYVKTSSIWLAGLAADGLPAGVLFIWVVVVLLWAITGRTWLALALALDVAIVLGAVNAAKLRVRLEPLYPSDVDFLRHPGFLLELTPPEALLLGGSVLLVLTVVIMLAGRGAAQLLSVPDQAPTRQRWTWLVRGATVLASAAVLVSAGSFNQPGNVWRRVFDADVARWAHWSQPENFMKNGFVAATLYDMPVAPMPEPAGYDRARMSEIVARYTKAARQTNAGRGAGALDDVNVVMVLSESFSDPTRLAGMELARDPIPTTRQLMRQSTSGSLLVGGYGGGTANVEFEVLTGMSLANLAPQMTTPFQQMVPADEEFPSLVRWFADHGHDTIAVHPFSSEVYRRDQVYPALGFQEFVDESALQASKRRAPGEFVGDAQAFDEILYQLRRHDRPVLTHLVTMQNHLPYEGRYSAPYDVTGLQPDDAAHVGQYVRGLRTSDDALDGFLDALRDLDEKTVVVFFGDHLPGIYPSEVVQANSERTTHETPFFLWRNFGVGRPNPQPSTSPGQLLPLLFGEVGARVPPYVALLDAVRASVPGLQRGRYVLADGSAVATPGELPAAAVRALEDYRLVQFDLAVGERWSEAGLFGREAGPR